jgi:hypothetical protein
MFGSGKVDESVSSERFFCRFGRVGQQQVHQRAVDSGDADVFKRKRAIEGRDLWGAVAVGRSVWPETDRALAGKSSL